jgi:hypothetical protein
MEVHGAGVVLRPWRLDDAPAVTAACQDAEIERWLAFVPQPYTEEEPASTSRIVSTPGRSGLRSRSRMP